MITIKKDIGFTTDVNGSLQSVTLKFTHIDIKRIKMLKSIVEDNKVWCIEDEFFAHKFKGDSDFTCGFSVLKIHSHGLTFYIEHKHSDELQYECTISYNELFK